MPYRSRGNGSDVHETSVEIWICVFVRFTRSRAPRQIRISSADAPEEYSEYIHEHSHPAEYIFCHRFKPFPECPIPAELYGVAGKCAAADPEHCYPGEERSQRDHIDGDAVHPGTEKPAFYKDACGGSHSSYNCDGGFPGPAEPFLERFDRAFQKVDKGSGSGEEYSKEKQDGKDLSEWDAPDDGRDGDEEKSRTGVWFHAVCENCGDDDQTCKDRCQSVEKCYIFRAAHHINIRLQIASVDYSPAPGKGE